MRYWFGDYEVDLDRVELRRNGENVPVQPQVFSVIEHLIEHRDRVIPKEELLDEIWGDRFVSESALTSRIKSARRALGDSGAQQLVIRTVQGRGYRFVAELESGAPTPTGEQPSPESLDASADIPARATPEITTSTDDWPLVGRHRALGIVSRLFNDRAVPGVVITGPEQIGASRFADECKHQCELSGAPVLRVVGLVSASQIPLAVLSHLLPDEVLATEQLADDLARAEILRKATSAMQQLGDGNRLMIIIENASELDSMTSTLLATLMTQGFAFGVAVRHPLTTLQSDAGSQRLTEIELERLDETDIDILLHRALGGPIASSTLQVLVEMSDGRPGLLRDLVETSIDNKSLATEDGVWRLVGAPSSTAMRSWNPTQLSAGAVRSAEILALMFGLPEAVATDLCGDEALEELDEGHLLALDGRGVDVKMSLADPLLAVVVRDSIGPLRERRVKRELADRVVSPDADPRVLATVASWALVDLDLDPAVLLAAAQTAMINGDMVTAGRLADYIGETNDPQWQLIEAEVSLRRSQWTRAERLFNAIDANDLDPISASHVLRRQAAVQFYGRARYGDTVDWLATEAENRGGKIGRALLARRIGMLAYLGRANETLEAANALGDLSGLTAIEVILSKATAYLHRGEFKKSLAATDEVDELLVHVPPAWADEPLDGVLVLRCSALLNNGELGRASDLIRQALPIGKRTALGYLPALAAFIELAAGRPRAAREHVRLATQTSHGAEFPQYLAIAEAIFSLTHQVVGQTSKARLGLDAARSAQTMVSGELHWKLAIVIAQLAADLGDPDDPAALLALADESAAVGAYMREADLLTAAALLDGSGATARLVTERVDGLVATFDGKLWPIKTAHVRAVANGDPVDRLLTEYRAIGYAGLADGLVMS